MAAAAVGIDDSEAQLWAREAVRMFSTVAIDPQRHSPPILRLFAQAKKALAKEPQTKVIVNSDVPGRIYAEGSLLGTSEGRFETTLPRGKYRFWLVTEDGMSAPYPMHLNAPSVQFEINTDLDANVTLTDALRLTCVGKLCSQRLSRLKGRLGVSSLYVVNPGPPEKMTSRRFPGEWSEEHAPQTLVIKPPIRFERFEPTYLLPLGTGQFAQGRNVWGASFAGAQVGLLAWHLWVRQARQEAIDSQRFGREAKLRDRQNLSAGLFWAAVATGITEALVHGLWRGQSSPAPIAPEQTKQWHLPQPYEIQ
jgi:hypothetical protein